MAINLTYLLYLLSFAGCKTFRRFPTAAFLKWLMRSQTPPVSIGGDLVVKNNDNEKNSRIPMRYLQKNIQHA